ADHVDSGALAAALPAMSGARSPQREADGSWQLGPARFDDLGHLVGLGDLVVESAGVDLYRAPVDNERARTRYPLEARWKRIGLDVARRRLVGFSSDPQDQSVLVICTRLGPECYVLGADRIVVCGLAV